MGLSCGKGDVAYPVWLEVCVTPVRFVVGAPGVGNAVRAVFLQACFFLFIFVGLLWFGLFVVQFGVKLLEVAYLVCGLVWL